MFLRGATCRVVPIATTTSTRAVASSSRILRELPPKYPKGMVKAPRPPVRRSKHPSLENAADPMYPPTSLVTARDDEHGHGQADAAHIPVYIPSDSNGVLDDTHGARRLLGNSALVIVRQLEMLNVFMGFEQANKYAILSPEGDHVGYMAEEDLGFMSTIARQALRTHRPFKSVVMDREGKPVLWIKRPFAFINSRIFVHAEEGEGSRLVGEAQQRWHPWRRRYDLFQSRSTESFSQFAKIDSGFWAWDFYLKDADDHLMATINRNFAGFGRELFTDTGQYVIRFDAAGQELALPPGANANVQGQTLILPERNVGGLTLDQRAMTLATAVSIDFDYFSRHSGSGGMGFPFMFWGGSDHNASTSTADNQAPLPDAAGGVGGAGGTAGAAAGAAGAPYYPSPETADDDSSNYGGQQQSPSRPDAPPPQQPWNEDVAEEEWGQDIGEEPAMRDPWEELFGDQNKGDSWGDGGDWGGGGGSSEW